MRKKSKDPYKFIRFNPLHKEAVYVMPQLVARIRKFIAEWTPEINADDFVSYIIKLTQEYPDSVRIWIAMTQEDVMVGHLIVTADVYLQEIYLHIQQLHMDDPKAIRFIKAKVLKSMQSWVKALNVALVHTGARQISRLYITSGRRSSMQAWERFMPGFKLVEERKLGIFKLPDDALVTDLKPLNVMVEA
jgi:beta-glucosidase/6-phospho-beta-glucosidase/beta-galactosidase